MPTSIKKKVRRKKPRGPKNNKKKKPSMIDQLRHVAIACHLTLNKSSKYLCNNKK